MRAVCLILLVACTAPREEERAPSKTPAVPTKATSANTGETIRFAVTPIASKEVMQREYTPLAEYLAARTGAVVKLVIPDGYADINERLVDESVDAAIISPLNYVLTAKRKPTLRVIATPLAQGSPTYASYIIVRENSEVRSVDELEGKRIAFVDERSTSGYLYPWAFLLERGVKPERFFGKIEFVGDHPAVIEAIATGRVDAGATFALPTGMLEANERLRNLRIVAKTGRIPYDAVVVQASVSQETTDALKAALLELNTRTDEGRRILRPSTGINAFLAANDSHYDSVRSVLARVNASPSTP